MFRGVLGVYMGYIWCGVVCTCITGVYMGVNMAMRVYTGCIKGLALAGRSTPPSSMKEEGVLVHAVEGCVRGCRRSRRLILNLLTLTINL